MSSFLVDTNIFIYATNEDLPHYRKAKEILVFSSRSPDDWCITWQNIHEYLSVVTSRKAFQWRPLSFWEAAENMDSVLALSNVRVIAETKRHRETFRWVMQSVKGGDGAFLNDCRLAAIMRENEVKRIVPADEGFRRFHFLKVENPFR